MSNPTLNTIISGLATALAGSDDIAEWVQTKYTDDALQQIYIGVDPEHPPVPDGAPVIEIATGKRRRDLDIRCVKHQVMIGVFVPCTAVTDADNVHTSTGVSWTNEFASLVEHACIKYMHDNHILWHPSDGFPDGALGKTFRAVWSMDVSVRDVIVY